MDTPGELGKDRYETWDELYVYCYRVASTVNMNIVLEEDRFFKLSTFTSARGMSAAAILCNVRHLALSCAAAILTCSAAFILFVRDCVFSMRPFRWA